MLTFLTITIPLMTYVLVGPLPVNLRLVDLVLSVVLYFDLTVIPTWTCNTVLNDVVYVILLAFIDVLDLYYVDGFTLHFRFFDFTDAYIWTTLESHVIS